MARAAEPIAVIGEADQPWLTDLRHELEAGGFTVGSASSRWALRLNAVSDQIEVVRRATALGPWTVDEVVMVPRAPAARRRAIVQAVEILRARRASRGMEPAAAETVAVAPAAADDTVVRRRDANVDRIAPPAAPPLPVAEARRPAEPDPATAPATTAAVDLARGAALARPVTTEPRRFSLGASAGVGGGDGGLGAVPAAGLVARWTGRRLALWSRATGAVTANTASGTEGTAAIRTMALSLGAGFFARENNGRRWSPLIGAEATGLFLRATGEGATGYQGQVVLASGLSAGVTAGFWFLVGDRLGVAVAGSAGAVFWQPVLRFAGRPAVSVRGFTAAATADLCWRF
ncbi:MAG TPA: hypothetical protein VFH73_18960 [Polyangia bacterium]|nr:hypothetical protein [Polyangia bacterium]